LYYAIAASLPFEMASQISSSLIGY